jgi:hypothetical protein
VNDDIDLDEVSARAKDGRLSIGLTLRRFSPRVAAGKNQSENDAVARATHVIHDPAYACW